MRRRSEYEGAVNLSRVMLADDHTLVLEALRKFLESRYDMVGTCCNG
jgi:DNA-binding NarL/FixJ family response regulator